MVRINQWLSEAEKKRDLFVRVKRESGDVGKQVVFDAEICARGESCIDLSGGGG